MEEFILGTVINFSRLGRQGRDSCNFDCHELDYVFETKLATVKLHLEKLGTPLILQMAFYFSEGSFLSHERFKIVYTYYGSLMS